MICLTQNFNVQFWRVPSTRDILPRYFLYDALELFVLPLFYLRFRVLIHPICPTGPLVSPYTRLTHLDAM